MSAVREERKEIFADTQRLYLSNARLVESIENSQRQQSVIPAEEAVFPEELQRYDTPAKVVVSKKRSLEAAMEYKGSRVCVLNFASATNPGGGVENGSSAQEEAICRCSTLFPCIAAEEIREQFHQKHRTLLKKEALDACYNNDCIYTPDVTVFKTDTELPELMSEEKWFQIDVISCAAPNLRKKPSNAMNPDSGNKAVSLDAEQLLDLHMKRIGRVLEIAGKKKEEVLILGAFGCGAFQNPPEIVAEAMARVLEEYVYHFKTIEFAVYCSPQDTRNYDVFKKRLESFAVMQHSEKD